MTLYELYNIYISNFAKNYGEEVRKSLNFYRNIDNDPEENPYSYFPDYSTRNKNNNPTEKPIFQSFIKGFYDEFFGKYDEEIKSVLSGHFPKMDGKTTQQLNKLKINYRYCSLSKEKILSKISFSLSVELIDEVMFEGKRRKQHSMLFNKFEPNYIELINITECDYCGSHVSIIYDFNKKIFRLSDHFLEAVGDCLSLSNKLKSIYKFEIKTPSKKLIFINDIRNIFEATRDDGLEVSIGTQLGRKKECEEYVKYGMAYFTMLNNSPHIYQNKTKNEIIIDPENVKLKWDKDTDNIKNINDYDDKGYVITDLWAVCMADYDDFMRRCAEKHIDPKSLLFVVVDIPSENIKVKYNFSNYLIQINY